MVRQQTKANESISLSYINLAQFDTPRDDTIQNDSVSKHTINLSSAETKQKQRRAPQDTNARGDELV